MRLDENMNPDNPYLPSALSHRAENASLRPSNRTMWRAYLIAPAVAPLAFVAIVLLAGFLSLMLLDDVNEASMLVLPAIALTFGVACCYFVAGVIGMPIAFYLRRVNSLNGYSIHSAAFGWATLCTCICAVYFVGGSWNELPLALGYVGLGVIPPVVLSGTAFWSLLRLFSKWEANAAMRKLDQARNENTSHGHESLTRPRQCE